MTQNCNAANESLPETKEQKMKLEKTIYFEIQTSAWTRYD